MPGTERRRRKNLALALTLGGVGLIMFILTLIKVGHLGAAGV